MSSFHFFTGENMYELLIHKKVWISEFVKKHGEENCVRMEGAQVTTRELLDAVSVLPFLSEKRLVVIDGIPRCTKEDIQLIASHTHPNVLVLWVDPKPDKRIAGVKELIALADVQEFKPLKGVSLARWIAAYVQPHGARIEQDAVTRLIEYTGEDQEMLAQELDKLTVYVGKRSITLQDVEMLSIPSDEGIIWRVSDLLSTGNKQEALLYAKRMLERGQDAHGLWAVLLSVLRNLVAVRAALDAGHSSAGDAASAAGVNPFAVRNLFPYAKRVQLQQLQDFLAWAVQADRDLKRGVYRATDEAPQELQVLIDRFILASP